MKTTLKVPTCLFKLQRHDMKVDLSFIFVNGCTRYARFNPTYRPDILPDISPASYIAHELKFLLFFYLLFMFITYNELFLNPYFTACLVA